MTRWLVAVSAIFVVVGLTRATTPVHGQLPVGYDAGWNLVSGPQGSHLVGAVGSIYTIPAGSSDYVLAPAGSALQRCRGYWAYFPSGGSLDTTGSTPAASCSIKTTPGQWAMLGNPATSRASITGADLALIYLGDSGYQGVDMVATGRGLWVLGSGEVTVTALGPDSNSAAAGSAGPGQPPVVPKGVTANLHDAWQLRVNSFTPNGTAAVLAANPLNTAPASGMQFVLVNVTVTYTGTGSDSFDVGYRLRARSATGAIYTAFSGATCGVVPQELPGTIVSSGTSVTGNACWAVPAGEANTLTLFDVPPSGDSDPSSWTFFALS